MSIQGSSHLAIEHSQLAYVGKDQHNTHVQGDLVQYFGREESWERTIWDEYRNIPTYGIHLKRSIGETLVKRWDQRKWRHLNACCKISIASISGEDKDSEFLYILYTGPDAFKAFQQDFEQFSCIKDINCIQLYGYNQGTKFPALVFHNTPVPVSHILEQNQFSPLLHTYIQHQSAVAQISSSNLDVCELWLDPRTGQLSRGLLVSWSLAWGTLAHGLNSNSTSNNPTPLSLQTYSDSTAVFNYLIQTLTASNILKGIIWSNRMTLRAIANKDIASVLSSLPGTIYNRTYHKIIARWPEDRKKWYFKLEGQWKIPDAMWESKVDMDNGLIRFTVLPLDIQDLQNQQFWLFYDLFGEWDEFAKSWLSQAHSVFSQLGICKNKWKKYAIMLCFWLVLEGQKRHLTQNNGDIPANKPLYLFILPVPRPSDSETIWNSWVTGSKYFWSFNSSGNQEVSEDLKLSFFSSRIMVRHVWWDHSAYNAIQQLHVSKGFDPKTLSLAQSLEFSILKVAGDEERFEELQDAESLSEATAGSSGPVIEGQVFTQSGSESREQSIMLMANRSYAVNASEANKAISDVVAPPTPDANINIGSPTVESDAGIKAPKLLKPLERNKV
ncbi:hypothetical protein Moror_4122 [Moniliophthora roreri MCA 2997]|uniref:Uncharacterized protein n=1 Tax=Moniliophthora roreri (strain MCA 2997) TaxID=1381753 RepID=V2XAG3_MONRO|nr:hypothetical protein Moror_4122 [Moniliophthora roreri MCA 2997]